MPIRLSTVLGVTREQLEKKGVFDSTIDFDSRLHLDPSLLSSCKILEFAQAGSKVATYFNSILTLLNQSKSEGDVLWRAALKRLTFGEGLNSGLGYSEKGTDGSGIGPEIAARILRTAKEIIDAGVIDPAIFDLVPLLEAGIGPDRISDMMSMILAEEFQSYSSRIATELGVTIPVASNGKQIVFVPKHFLSDLPVAEQWEDIQVAAAYNEGVREAISAIINKSWKQIAKEYSKRDLKRLLIENPDLLKELLAQYKNRPGNGYDFVLDHLGILLWDTVGRETARRNPLDLSKYQKVTEENVLEVVTSICDQYQKLIEHNALVDSLYDSNGDRRPERFAQLLFFAVADSYCQAHGLDLNREINAGSGALDFKVSHGLAKVNVEIKYSSNPKLVEGYEKQLPAYNKAEGVKDQHSLYLVLKVNKNQELKLKKISGIIDDRTRRGMPYPKFKVIDAIKKPSASKR